MIQEEYRIVQDGVERVLSIGGHRVSSKIIYQHSTNGIDIEGSHVWWHAFLAGRSVEPCLSGSVRIVDLFSGVGGLSLGAQQAVLAAGLKPIFEAVVDVDHPALKVYSSNFSPSIALDSTVSSLVDYHVNGRQEGATFAYQPEIIDEDLEQIVGDVDLVLAGPPCQGHSSLNNHTRHDDPRNELYLTAAAAAVALGAKAIVIENVPAVLRDRKKVVLTARSILEQSGYQVSDGVLRGTDVGAPQTRNRHFLVATRQPHLSIDLTAIGMARVPMTLFEAIGDLESLSNGSIFDSAPILSAENQKRIAYLFDNDRHDLPNEERPDCHKNGHTYPSVYGRLRWDEPAPTITGGFMSPGRGRFIHPSQRRVITAHEAARIQGFPDGFVFKLDSQEPTRKQLGKWIGDAVPTQLGYVATLAALSSMFLDVPNARADDALSDNVPSPAERLLA
jgi:DNA (cytosine-5)-methyltransferase 1